MIELLDTDSAGIAAEFTRNRIEAGSPVMGMVMTFVVVVDEDGSDAALACAREASQEHPARVLGVVLGDVRGDSVVSAQVGIGSGWAGETALIRLRGPVVRHSDSVVLPLLLPDSPVAVWWPAHAPDDPAADPIGALATRRITDAAAATRAPTKAIDRQCAAYSPGDTDLAWTRVTPWRALLAAALEPQPGKAPVRVTAASVTAERISPSAELLGAWLADRLGVEVTRSSSEGPGITEVVLETAHGPITISRTDGRLATFSSPGSPDRPVALKRREVPALLSEELRHLDEDDVYAATARLIAKRTTKQAGKKAAGPAKKATRKKTAEAKASGARTAKTAKGSR